MKSNQVMDYKKLFSEMAHELQHIEDIGKVATYIVSERKLRFFPSMFRDISPKPLCGILSRVYERLFASPIRAMSWV